MKEHEWIVPGIVLTIACGLAALTLIPSVSGFAVQARVLIGWVIFTALMASLYGVFLMMVLGVERPIAKIRPFFRREWRLVLYLLAVILITGMNMVAFLWLKPLLNYLIPFQADPLLADVDWQLFLGRDPEMVLSWLNTSFSALFYHRGWLFLLMLTVILVALKPASPEKSAMMLSYFLLWTLVGPLLHSMLPAAGPIFYERLGYGDRFAALNPGQETERLADYLWAIYATKSFGAGSGISAMPSLHIATMSWILLAFFVFVRAWFIPVSVVGALIFLLSISLGWHYAIDGLAGAACALIVYLGALAYYRGRWTRRVPEPSSAATGSSELGGS